ncbi:MAG: hypothetical protein QW331_03220 [Candidatus Woesearchaeota archaeon]
MRLQRIPENLDAKISDKDVEEGRKKVIINSEVWQEHIRHCDEAQKNPDFFIRKELERERLNKKENVQDFLEKKDKSEEKTADQTIHAEYGAGIKSHGEGIQCNCGMRAVLTSGGNVEMIFGNKEVSTEYSSEKRNKYGSESSGYHARISFASSIEYGTSKRTSKYH